MRTSYSALETFKHCPQKYKFQELDKIKAPKGKEALFGSLIHDCLEFMFSKDPLFPTLDEVIARFRDKWPGREKMKLTADEEAVYMRQGEEILRRFYSKNPPWNFNVVDLESRFEVVVEDPKTGEVHILAGIMDRIDRIDESSFEIIDYKTTRRMISQEALDKNLQLSLYHLGLTKRWPHVDPEKIKLSLLYVKHGEKLSTTRTKESAEAVREQLLKTIREIGERQKTGDFPPIPSALCDWCAYKPICPAWRHLYKKEEEETVDDKQAKEIIREYFEIKETEQKNKKRIAELQKQLTIYLEKEKLDRVFGEKGYISRKFMERFAYDFDQVKAVLSESGHRDLWEAILSPDEKKLKVISKTLPEEIRLKVENLRTLTKRYQILTASSKKISASQVEQAICA